MTRTLLLPAFLSLLLGCSQPPDLSGHIVSAVLLDYARATDDLEVARSLNSLATEIAIRDKSEEAQSLSSKTHRGVLAAEARHHAARERFLLVRNHVDYAIIGGSPR